MNTGSSPLTPAGRTMVRFSGWPSTWMVFWLTSAFGSVSFTPACAPTSTARASFGRQLFHRFAGAGIQHIEKRLGVVFNVASECTVDGQGEKGTGQDFAESVHVHFLFGPE